MRAIEYDAYGGIERLVLRDAAEPSSRRGGIRVRVVCAALNPKDGLFRRGNFRVMSGLRFPKRCGVDFAGEVAASETPRFRIGDRVFGALSEWTYARGTLADYVAPRDHEVAALPAGVSFEDGAAIALVGMTALQALRDIARVRAGARVLIHGASGGVGTAAIQIARILGARVTAVSSAANRELCLGLGAEVAIDYESGELSGERFDCAFDVFGSFPFARARAVLAPDGVFVATVPSPARAAADFWSRLVRRGPRLVIVRPDPADLGQLGAWLTDGSLRAVVDSRFALPDFAGAFRRLESKRARGKIVIDVAGG